MLCSNGWSASENHWNSPKVKSILGDGIYTQIFWSIRVYPTQSLYSWKSLWDTANYSMWSFHTDEQDILIPCPVSLFSGGKGEMYLSVLVECASADWTVLVPKAWHDFWEFSHNFCQLLIIFSSPLNEALKKGHFIIYLILGSMFL